MKGHLGEWGELPQLPEITGRLHPLNAVEGAQRDSVESGHLDQERVLQLSARPHGHVKEKQYKIYKQQWPYNVYDADLAMRW